MSDWWIYENWMVNKAKVHRGNCSHCNHGKGQNKPKEEGEHGKWHGSYLTRDEAWESAKRLGQKNTGYCTFCCNWLEKRILITAS